MLGKLAAKDNPQTMLGVFAQRWVRAPVFESLPADGLWVALEGVRDPGNLGTIIRTADAVGAGGVVLDWQLRRSLIRAKPCGLPWARSSTCRWCA